MLGLSPTLALLSVTNAAHTAAAVANDIYTALVTAAAVAARASTPRTCVFLLLETMRDWDYVSHSLEQRTSDVAHEPISEVLFPHQLERSSLDLRLLFEMSNLKMTAN